MTHLKTFKARKRFVCKVIDNTKSSKRMNKLYRAIEKAINYKPKKR